MGRFHLKSAQLGVANLEGAKCVDFENYYFQKRI